MKRVLLWSLVTALAVLGVGIRSARAQGGYGLYILGTEVTSANCNDLSSLDTEKIKLQAGGEFRYDAAHTTLFMKGVTITGEVDGLIENKGVDNLTIQFAKENVLKSMYKIGIVLRKVTTFQGDGELTVETESTGIILHEDVTLTISGITVTIPTSLYGIKGNHGEKGELLMIKKATVTVNADIAALFRLHNFVMQDVKIIEPADGKWIPYQHSIMEGDQKAKKVKIVPPVAVTDVSLNPSSLEFTIGDPAKQLTATVKPDNATDKTVTWASDNTDVASVENGSVTPTGIGEATITVTTKDGNKEAKCKVMVKAKTADASGAVEDTLLASISVAPNPFTAQLRILNPEGIAAHYELVNAAGIVVRSGALSSTEEILDTRLLPAGVYFVRLTAQNNAQKTIKVSK